MTTQKHTLFQSVLARISLGAVPVDGVFWFDPRSAGKALAAARGLQAQPARGSDQPARGSDQPARDSGQPAASATLGRSPCT